MSTAGRVCPVRYRYGPGAIAGAPERLAETVYVIGGLYGNQLSGGRRRVIQVSSELHAPGFRIIAGKRRVPERPIFSSHSRYARVAPCSLHLPLRCATHYRRT